MRGCGEVAKMPEVLIGKVTHYFGRAGVAGLGLEAPLSKGDRIHIQGHTTELSMQVESMEIDHQQIDQAQPGDDVAIKVSDRVRVGDSVYREVEE